MRQLFIISLLPVCLFSGAALAQDCKDINFTLDSNDIGKLTLDVGAGSLGVIGSEDNDTRIQVRAQACADSRSQLEELDVLHERRGDAWVIRTDIPELHFSIFSLLGGNYSARIDIDVMVPAGMLLEIDDGSGDINVRDFQGELRIEDGSGDIQISNVTGPVRIDDGSGDMELRNIDGSVEIEDGSGDIEIDGVGGDVVIEDDGSGDIDVRDVRGDFIARDTGSGDVNFRDIAGRTEVRD